MAAFGKHPGWDDHLPDPGIDNARLAALKSALYTDGIGGNIDSGRWANLSEERRLPTFNHLFFSETHLDWVLGKMWPSHDGTIAKRSHYPMVVCIQVTGVSLHAAGVTVMQRLERLEEEFTATQSANEVLMGIDAARADLRDTLQQIANNNDSTPATQDTTTTATATKQIADWFLQSSDEEGLLRMLYQLDRELPQPFRVGSRDQSGSWDTADVKRGWHCRVPRGPMQGFDCINLWQQFLHEHISPGTPCWVIMPTHSQSETVDATAHEATHATPENSERLGGNGGSGGWVDIVVGWPTREIFFALRAASREVPLATEVPYDIDSDSRARLLNLIESIGR